MIITSKRGQSHRPQAPAVCAAGTLPCTVYVCVYVCTCVYVCVRVYVNICRCAYVYTAIFVYVYSVCEYL